MLVDTHCHLNFNAFKDDADKVIEETLARDIWMINVGSQNSTSNRAVLLAQKYNRGVYAAVALHPLHLAQIKIDEKIDESEMLVFETKAEEFDKNYYLELAQNPKVVAIGETGLDYANLPADKKDEIIAKQKEALKKHLELADELNLPVILHCREAYDDIYQIISDFKNRGKLKRNGVMHCFLGDWQMAKKFLDLDLFISFNGIITFAPRNEKDRKKAKILYEVIQKTPFDKILAETDAPYLAPIPFRGQRNKPEYVKFVVEKIAELTGKSFKKIADQTTKNAIELFNLK